MEEDKLLWCCRQKRGVSLIEPKMHLIESYIKEADETIDNMLVAKGKWRVITAYYASYHALYAVLMKLGIKSEIHDCTLELMSIIGGFSEAEKSFMKHLKEDRIQAQYYLKEVVLKNENKVKQFVLKCKSVLNNFDDTAIEAIRGRISALIKKGK